MHLSPFSTQLTILVHTCNRYVFKTYSVAGTGFSTEYTIKSKMGMTLSLWKFYSSGGRQDDTHSGDTNFRVILNALTIVIIFL